MEEKTAEQRITEYTENFKKLKRFLDFINDDGELLQDPDLSDVRHDVGTKLLDPEFFDEMGEEHKTMFLPRFEAQLETVREIIMESLYLFSEDPKKEDKLKKMLNILKLTEDDLGLPPEEEMDLYQGLKKVVDRVGTRMREQNMMNPEKDPLSIGLELPEELPTVMGYPWRLKKIFYNLVRNSVEAMGKKGNIWVRAELDHDDPENLIQLTLENDGPPINIRDLRDTLGKRGYNMALENDEVVLQKLFDRGITVGKEKGTGKGLAIVREMAERHGGSVFVENMKPKGVRFSVWLPHTERTPKK